MGGPSKKERVDFILLRGCPHLSPRRRTGQLIDLSTLSSREVAGASVLLGSALTGLPPRRLSEVLALVDVGRGAKL